MYAILFILTASNRVTLTNDFRGRINLWMVWIALLISPLLPGLHLIFQLPFHICLLTILEVFHVPWVHVRLSRHVSGWLGYLWVEWIIAVHLLIDWHVVAHVLFNAVVRISVQPLYNWCLMLSGLFDYRHFGGLLVDDWLKCELVLLVLLTLNS